MLLMLPSVLFRIELLELLFPPPHAYMDSLERFLKSQMRLSWKNKKGKNMRKQNHRKLDWKSEASDLFI